MFEANVDIPLRDLVERVRSLAVAAEDDARVEQLELLESLKRAASAAQALVTVRLVSSQRAAQVAAGVPADRVGRGVAEQVALARGESPHAGGRFVGMSTALVAEMPNTLAALEQGRVSEWTATCLVRETAVLQESDRSAVDAALVPMLIEPGTSSGRLTRAARGLAQQLDPAAAAKRAAKAVTDRTVTIRPAPDCMVHVTALLPVAEGVGVFAALRRAAATAAATGDPRSRGQVMADTLVARVTGREPLTEPVAVHVDLVMTDSDLLGARGRSAGTASVRARGQAPVPVPAAVARGLVAAAGAAGRAFVRRLYTTPDQSTLVAMDSRARRFPAGLARLVAVADQTCRTPFCDAPVAEIDHVTPHCDGGSTSRLNARGLCRRCNLAVTAPGWTSARAPDDRIGAIETTTPTGRVYTGVPPPLLGSPSIRRGDAAAHPRVDPNPALAASHRRTA